MRAGGVRARAYQMLKLDETSYQTQNENPQHFSSNLLYSLISRVRVILLYVYIFLLVRFNRTRTHSAVLSARFSIVAQTIYVIMSLASLLRMRPQLQGLIAISLSLSKTSSKCNKQRENRQSGQLA